MATTTTTTAPPPPARPPPPPPAPPPRPPPGHPPPVGAHESLLYLASHPLIWPLALASSRWPILRLPGIGVVVNDPALAKAILQRDREFTKTSPGSMGPLYDQVLGPYALLNMDGPDHRALRTRLAGVFSPTGVAATTAEVFAAPLADATATLAAGGQVDLADLARDLTGQMTCRLLGIVPSRAHPGSLRLVRLLEERGLVGREKAALAVDELVEPAAPQPHTSSR